MIQHCSLGVLDKLVQLHQADKDLSGFCDESQRTQDLLVQGSPICQVLSSGGGAQSVRLDRPN